MQLYNLPISQKRNETLQLILRETYNDKTSITIIVQQTRIH